MNRPQKLQVKAGPKWRYVLRLLSCFVFIAAVVIYKNHKIFGHEFDPTETQTQVCPLVQNEDGSIVIRTKDIAKDIEGFGGNTPLEIHIKDGYIVDIKDLENGDSPDFFNKAKEKLFPQWIGLSLEQAADLEVDGVSGATLSSNAIIGTMKRGLEYAAGSVDKKQTVGESRANNGGFRVTLRFICAFLVMFAGCMLPLKFKGKRYRMIQLILNVVVLGLWCGTFVSFSLMTNVVSNGIGKQISIVALLLLSVALFYPLFGKTNHYCNWLCPMGSLQELAGKATKKKWKISPQTMKWLNRFNDWLWIILMLFLLSGVLSHWMDYELFTAFLFNQASIVVLVIAVIMILLSCVVSRPYCRFVCPTGKTFRMIAKPATSGNNKNSGVKLQHKSKTIVISASAVVIVIGLLFAMAAHKNKAENTNPVYMNQKSIVAFYSQTGTTKKVAAELACRLGIDTLSINVDRPYDGTFQETVDRIRHEAKTGDLPKIKPMRRNLANYDTIFLGYPIWSGTYASPIAALVREYNFAGKVIIPFCTFGSGGLAASTEDLIKALPEAYIKSGYGVRHSRISKMPEEVDRFLKISGFIQGAVEQYPDYSEQKPVTPEDCTLFDEACGGYPYHLGTPVTVGKRETSQSTDYEFVVKREDRDTGAETKALIYVTVSKKEGAKPEFTQVVKRGFNGL